MPGLAGIRKVLTAAPETSKEGGKSGILQTHEAHHQREVSSPQKRGFAGGAVNAGSKVVCGSASGACVLTGGVTGASGNVHVGDGATGIAAGDNVTASDLHTCWW